VGGADVLFSNNGPLSGATHTAGTTTITVPTAGTYQIDYNVSITAGVGAAIAIAVNGTVDASTPILALVATGNISGTAILTLAAGDVLTLRNNSATPLTLTLAPEVGAQFNIILLS
jgi:acetyl-CoA carboxylase alpha subunit